MDLLTIVQKILSDLDSDEVNSISDTVEATQVASIVEDTYYNIIDGKQWPQLYSLFQLEASGNPAKPTHMKLPSNIVALEYLKYNCIKINDTFSRVTEMKYKTPYEFMHHMNTRRSDATNILDVVDDSGVHLSILKQTPPKIYTSFDNEHVVLDAYDGAVDSTLQSSKTEAYGRIIPLWTQEDDFIPPLPAQAYAYLLNEAKATAFIVLKQSPNPKAEQHSVTQRRRMSQEAFNTRNGITLPDYGRKRHGVREKSPPRHRS